MNLTLIRKEKSEHGIFSEMPELGLVCLEHAYIKKCFSGGGSPVYEAKIPNGTWKCVRGLHRLHMKTPQFETFEIIVPGHTGLLFHIGNKNEDSTGCVLLGKERIDNQIHFSRMAFNKFMDEMDGINTLDLTVKD